MFRIFTANTRKLANMTGILTGLSGSHKCLGYTLLIHTS